MPKKNTKNYKVGLKSDLQPIINEPPITLRDAQKEIALAIEKAKEGFLKTAKIEAGEEIRNQVQTDKASLITVFGIFASIVSFLTIEFQFLKTICSIQKLIGFTFILAALLLFFNIALDYLIKSRTDKDTPKPILFFIISVVCIFILGVFFTYFGNEEKCNENKIFNKYSENFELKQGEFNQNYTKEQENKFSEINNRITNIETLINKK